MITLEDMVASQSISGDGSELLRGIAAARHSFLVYARPRNAGKSTLAQAILAAAPAAVPRREFFGTAREYDALSAESHPGYLQVAEIGHRGRPGYLAGEEVVRAFRLVAQGWALASSLHADSVQEVFEVLGRNGVAPAAAAAVRFLAKVRPLGDPNDPGTRRVVEQVHEVSGVDGDTPISVRRYHWDGAA